MHGFSTMVLPSWPQVIPSPVAIIVFLCPTDGRLSIASSPRSNRLFGHRGIPSVV